MRERGLEDKNGAFEYNRKLREGYYNMPMKDYLKLRDELCAECYWSLNTFYNRINLQRAVLPLEIAHVEKVFKNYGIDIFKDLKH